MWTAGGAYDMQSGAHTPQPALFKDQELTQLSFAGNGSLIAGIRNTSTLELYSIPAFNLLATASNAVSLLCVSPSRNFIIILHPPPRNPSHAKQS
jgi:hypothetical protein